MHNKTSSILSLKFSTEMHVLAQGLCMAFVAALLGSQISAQILIKTRTLFAPVPVSFASGRLILDSLDQQYSWIRGAHFLNSSPEEFPVVQPILAKSALPVMVPASSRAARKISVKPKFAVTQTKQAKVQPHSRSVLLKPIVSAFENVVSIQSEVVSMDKLRMSIQTARKDFFSDIEYSHAQVNAAFELKFNFNKTDSISNNLNPEVPIAIELSALTIDSLKIVSGSSTYVRANPRTRFTKKTLSKDRATPGAQATVITAQAITVQATQKEIPGIAEAAKKISPINLLSLFKHKDVNIQTSAAPSGEQVNTQTGASLGSDEGYVSVLSKNSEAMRVNLNHQEISMQQSALEKTKAMSLTVWSQAKDWAASLKSPKSWLTTSKRVDPVISQPTSIPSVVLANQVNSQNQSLELAKNQDATPLSMSSVNDEVNEAAETQTPEVDSIANDVAKPLAVEAFDWKTAIPNAELTTLAYEGFAGSATARWGIVRAADHWATLTYKRFNGFSSAPLLSKNTILLLSNLAKEQQADTAGIVFGRVPKGWSVELSEHRHQAIYLTEDKKAFVEKTYTSDVSNSEARYFVFLNAAPGTKILYLTQSGSKETSALPISVQSTQATYLDLPKPEKKSLILHFRDASSVERKSEGNLTVWPEGQSELHTIKTDKSGRGELKNIYVIPGHTVILDAVSSAGITHRYSLSDHTVRGFGGAKPKEIDLYVFGFKQINKWKGQLEGGLSSQSGLVVAAYPGLSQNELIDKRFPTLSPVNPGGTLIPETYTLSSKETLDVKSPLEVGVPRSLSVHVPEGPVVLELQRDGGSPTWSQIIYSSPDVVNVVVAE